MNNILYKVVSGRRHAAAQPQNPGPPPPNNAYYWGPPGAHNYPTAPMPQNGYFPRAEFEPQIYGGSSSSYQPPNIYQPSYAPLNPEDYGLHPTATTTNPFEPSLSDYARSQPFPPSDSYRHPDSQLQHAMMRSYNDENDMDRRYHDKIAMLMARDQPASSGSSNPDPGRSKVCHQCRININDMHSHPWSDPGRAKFAIGHMSEASEAAGLRGSLWSARRLDSECALCSLVRNTLDIYLSTNRLEISRDDCSYRFKPTELGSAYDRDPRRVIGQTGGSHRRPHSRWALGLELLLPGPRATPMLLGNAVHGAIRPLPKPFYLKLEEAPFETRAFLHGRNRSLECDIDLLRSWISLCAKYHGRRCSQRSQPRGTIRLIDTVQHCLVRSNSSPACRDYVALSYVWGNKEQSYAATAEEYARLFEPGALFNLTLSKTVADAILLVQNLGFRYLWLDALCIRQDSDSDKHEQIAQMGFVYESALFTIIAAAGDDCDAGLPGLRSGTRVQPQQSVQMGNITLLSSFESSPQLSKWARRGWTFQEELLSARRLIFTPDLVTWYCPCATWYEDSQLESEDPVGFMPPGESVRPGLAERYAALKPEIYFELVEQYARRELSYATDSLNAFSGILSMLSKYSGEEFLWGHMVSIFEEQLFWFGTATERSVTFRDHFPSWSWVSREGQLSLNYYDTYVPDVVCYVLNTKSFTPECVPVNEKAMSRKKTANVLSRTKHRMTMKEIEAIIPSIYLKPGFHLFFYTYTATFYLWPQGHLTLITNAPATSWDNTSMLRPERGYLLPSLPTTELCAKGPRECILLGHRPSTSRYDDPHVIVMLIRRDDMGITYREAIAVIPTERWKLAPKRWELIILG
jgi:hypothetical protein